MGVAPFLSWVRGLEDELPQQVDFLYSNDGPAPFGDEIVEVAGRFPTFRVHLIDTSVQGRVTAAGALAAAGDVRGLSVFMCGPQPMLRGLQRDLQRAGVPARNIHREFFDWR